MALQATDLLVIHRPGPGAGSLFNCPVGEFKVDDSLATETSPGIVRLATVDEVIEGTNNQLAISPKSMADAFLSPLMVFDGNSGSGDDDYDTTTAGATVTPLSDVLATEEVAGIVQLATSAETIAGVVTTKAITPAGLRDTLDSNAVNFDGGEYAV